MFIDNYIDGLVDHNVLVQNAMAKSAVRALDVVTEFVYESTGHYPTRAGMTGEKLGIALLSVLMDRSDAVILRCFKERMDDMACSSCRLRKN